VDADVAEAEDVDADAEGVDVVEDADADVAEKNGSQSHVWADSFNAKRFKNLQ
jgi:hypothetical protein